MQDLLKTGATWLAGMQQENASQWVLYSRGGSSCRMPAMLGRSPFDVVDGAGGLLRVQSEDFIIKTIAMKMDAIAITPDSGDRITFRGEVFEVSPPALGIPHWTWDGPHHASIRVHTKKIGVVP